MSTWREQTDAQIAEINGVADELSDMLSPDCEGVLRYRKWAEAMQALKDVAVAAEWTRHPNGREQDGFDLDAALDKLREVSA